MGLYKRVSDRLSLDRADEQPPHDFTRPARRDRANDRIPAGILGVDLKEWKRKPGAGQAQDPAKERYSDATIERAASERDCY
jgi:hypothetical protein